MRRTIAFALVVACGAPQTTAHDPRPKTVTQPDLQAIPAGEGWWCHTMEGWFAGKPGWSYCYRKEARCREPVDDGEAGPCAPQETASCFTTAERAVCARSMDDCTARRARKLADSDPARLVSPCTEIGAHWPRGQLGAADESLRPPGEGWWCPKHQPHAFVRCFRDDNMCEAVASGECVQQSTAFCTTSREGDVAAYVCAPDRAKCAELVQLKGNVSDCAEWGAGAKVPTRIAFEPDTASIPATSYAALNELAANMRAHPHWNLRLEGRVSGSDRAIGKQRAETIKAYLVAQGASAERIFVEDAAVDAPAEDTVHLSFL